MVIDSEVAFLSRRLANKKAQVDAARPARFFACLSADSMQLKTLRAERDRIEGEITDLERRISDLLERAGLSETNK